MTLVSVVLGAVLAVAGGAFSGWAVGRAWSSLRTRPEPLIEGGLGLAGVICSASAATLLLHRAWAGVWIPGPTSGLADPLFAAALVGTVAGHVALLAWARATGAPLALVVPGARWLGIGALSGLVGVTISVAWVEAARGLGLPVIDQDIIADVLAAPSGPARAAVLGFIVVGAPVLEELVFRGFLQGAVARAVGPGAALVASALTFGLFHMADPSVVPVLVLLGGLFAWLRRRSGSVLPGMIGHAVNNGVAILLAMAAT